MLIYGQTDKSLHLNLTDNTSIITDSVKVSDSVIKAKDVSMSVIKLGQDLPQIHEKYKTLLIRLGLPEQKQVKLMAFGETMFTNLSSEITFLEEKIVELQKQVDVQKNNFEEENKDATKMIKIIEKKDFEIADLSQELKLIKSKFNEKESQMKTSKMGVEVQLVDFRKNLEIEVQKNEFLMSKLENFENRNTELQKINYDLKTIIDNREKNLKEIESRIEKEKQIIVITLESQIAGLHKQLHDYELALQHSEDQFKLRTNEILAQNESLQKECLNYKNLMRTYEDDKMKFELMENNNKFDYDNSLISGSMSLFNQRKEDDEFIVPKSPENSFEIHKTIENIQNSSPVNKSMRKQKTFGDTDNDFRINSKFNNDKIDELETQVSELKTNLSALQNQNFESNKKIDQLNFEINKLSSEKKSIMEKFDSLLNSNIELKGKIAGMTDGLEVEQLKKSNQELAEQLAFYKNLSNNLEKNFLEVNHKVKLLSESQNEATATRPRLGNQTENEHKAHSDIVYSRSKIPKSSKLENHSNNQHSSLDNLNNISDPINSRSNNSIDQILEPGIIDSSVNGNQLNHNFQVDTNANFTQRGKSNSQTQNFENQGKNLWTNSNQQNFANQLNPPNLPDQVLPQLPNSSQIAKPQIQPDVSYHEFVSKQQIENAQISAKNNLEIGPLNSFSTSQQNNNNNNNNLGFQNNSHFYTPNQTTQKQAFGAIRPSLSDNKLNDIFGNNVDIGKINQEDPKHVPTPVVSRRTIDFDKFDFNLVPKEKTTIDNAEISNQNGLMKKTNSLEMTGWNNNLNMNQGNALQNIQNYQEVTGQFNKPQINPQQNSAMYNQWPADQQAKNQSTNQNLSPVMIDQFTKNQTPAQGVYINRIEPAWNYNMGYGSNVPLQETNSPHLLQHQVCNMFSQPNAYIPDSLNSNKNLQMQNFAMDNTMTHDKLDTSNQTSQYDLSIFESGFNQYSQKEINNTIKNAESNSTRKLQDFDFASVNHPSNNLQTPPKQAEQISKNRLTFSNDPALENSHLNIFAQPEQNNGFNDQSIEGKLLQLETNYRNLVNEKRGSELQKLEMQREINNLKFDIAMNKSNRKEPDSRKSDTKTKSEIISEKTYWLCKTPLLNSKTPQPTT
jgi:predicted  nucleic acid-binding Zn-ribbon protein